MNDFRGEIAEPRQPVLYHNDPQCGHTFTRREHNLILSCDWFTCVCGAKIYDLFDTYVGARVLASCAKYLDNPPRTWYHATTSQGWPNNDENLVVHIGTRRTARARGESLLQHSASTYYTLYKLQLRDDVIFSPYVVVDNNFWPVRLEEDHGVYRYINKCESPGSISAYTRFDNLKIVGRTEF